MDGNTPIDCPWNFPLLAAPKLAKEKEQSDDIRLCIDAIFLNDKIIDVVNINLSLFRIIINKMGKFNWISVIDLADSYHQFSIKLEDQHELTFTIDGKRSMFVVAPFGVKVMTGILQKIIERLLADLETPPFLDDIAIVSATEENYIKLVKEVLKRLIYDAELRINLKKSNFLSRKQKS
jgi:hypothetical protein